MFRQALAIAALFVAASGCSPQVGDDCGSSIDCDFNGTRICDLAQPGGYCTVRNCERGTCPDGESVCVEFNPDVPRLSVTYCMATCGSDSACRTDDGYRCLAADAIGATSLDGEGAKFCVIPR